MAKIFPDIIKLFIASLFGFLFSLLLFSAGVINKKADITYVDKQDEAIEMSFDKYKTEHKEVHTLMYDDIKHIRTGVDDLNKFLREHKQ